MTARQAAGSSPPSGPDAEVTAAFEVRAGPMLEFTERAGDVVAACHAMAVRFHQGASWWSSAPAARALTPSTS